MNQQINIKEVSEITLPEAPKIVKYVEIIQTNLVLGDTLYVLVALKNDKGQQLKMEEVALTKEQYNNWGEDDSYVLDCVIENLGLSK